MSLVVVDGPCGGNTMVMVMMVAALTPAAEETASVSGAGGCGCGGGGTATGEEMHFGWFWVVLGFNCGSVVGRCVGFWFKY